MRDKQVSVMLVDANFCNLPLLQNIKKQGLDVSVCGNILDDPCHFLADYSYGFDYSQKEELLAAVLKGDFPYLVPGCNDKSYISSAWVAEQCSLPGFDPFDTVLTLHYKDKFRNFAIKSGYPTPNVAFTVEETKKLEYPLIVKPIDAFSGRGTQKITQKKQLPYAFNRARQYSFNKQALIEEFKTGSLHSHSAFIKSGCIYCDFFVDEYCSVFPYQVNSSSLTTKLKENICNDIRDCITQLVQELRLVDGLLHTQLLVDDKNFWLIELTRRCPGDLYSQLIELSTGFNYSEAYISPFINQGFRLLGSAKPYRHYARHTISVESKQIFFSIHNSLSAKSSEIIQLKACGKQIKEAPFDKAGIIFVEFDSEADKERLTPELKHYIKLNSFDNYGV